MNIGVMKALFRRNCTASACCTRGTGVNRTTILADVLLLRVEAADDARDVVHLVVHWPTMRP